MNDAIIIEVEMVNTVFGLQAKFYKGKSLEAQVALKSVLDTMNSLTEYYNNNCGKAVMFTTA